MSFAKFDVEAQKSINPSLETSELDRAITRASDNLNDLANMISTLDRSQKQVGTKRDSYKLRSQIESIIKKVSELENLHKELSFNVADIINNKKSNNEVSSQQTFTQDKLTKEFNTLNKNYTRIIREYQDKKHMFVLAKPQESMVEESPAASIDERTPLMQQQIQVVDQIDETELEYHTMLTEERNQEIDKINKGVHEINSIFKDLGHLVNQQGGQIDTVEDNLMTLSTNTQKASQELVIADDYQKKKRKLTCCILMTLCVVFGVVILAIIS